MTSGISTSELSALQSLPWSGKPVYFDADRLPNAPRAFEAWITESTPRLRAIYDQHKKELNELRLVIRPVDGVDYLMSIDSPSSLVRRHSALSCSRSATSSITVPAPSGCNYLPFQLAGIEYARQHGNILIGDEMGLGKTVQALGIFNDNPSYRTMLIICPAYLKLNWRNEAQKWLVRPATFTLVEGRKFAYPKGVTGVHVAIINYDILHDHLEWINGQRFDLVVMDECHYIKTPEARRTKALLDLNAKRFVALSGTPAVNRPIELWPIIKRLHGKKALGYWAFATTYCDLKVTPWGKDVSGCSNPVALRNWLRANLMVRRLKADVLTELPAKMRQVIELPPSTAIKNVVDMENQKFAPHESTIIALKEKMDAAEISDDDTTFHACASAIAKEIQMGMLEIAKERSRLSELKAPLIAAHVESCLSADPSMKIIVFTHHREAASIITAALAEYGAVTIHGGVSPDDRQAICARFQSVPECRAIVGTMGAMGVGLTLTASSRVIFVELDWRPGIMAQAEDRAHRIGQLESVLCQYFIFPDSVESKMIGSILEKMENLSQILDQGGRENDDAPKKTRAKSAGPSLEAFSQKITNEVKKLVLRGLKILAKMDADRATRQDAKGFSKWDSPIGHRLASSEALTTREAAFGLRLIHRYRRQIPDIAQDLDVADKPKGTTLVK